MILDETYWTDRYIAQNTPWQLAQVSAPLKSIIDKLEDKNLRILIPGAGNSNEAVYLLEQGFSCVTVLDISQQPLRALEEKLDDLDGLRLVHEDFFAHTGSYDLILEQTFFCALESRFRESYPSKSHELLNENGRIKGLLFNFTQDRQEPPYGGTRSEYVQLFSPYYTIQKLEKSTISEPERDGKELIFDFIKK